MLGLTHFEQSVLEKLVAGEGRCLSTLRAQVDVAQLRERQMTGVGFFCYFTVGDDVERVDKRTFDIGDVNASIAGLAHGAGFVLFIKDGRLDFLEGFAYDERWPETIGSFELSYRSIPRSITIED